MSQIDNELIGSVINAIPLDKMIAAPLDAMIKAQVSASKSYADFLMGVCIQGGKAVAIQFEYDETVTDSEGAYKGTIARKMQIPLIAAVTHPNIAIEEGNIEFELTISQQAMDTKSTDAGGEMTGKFGWGPFSLSLKGQVSHKSSQTRKTDTRARYSFNTRVARQEPPEALMRVIEFLTETATKPTRMPGVTIENKEKLPVSTLPMPDVKANTDQAEPSAKKQDSIKAAPVKS